VSVLLSNEQTIRYTAKAGGETGKLHIPENSTLEGREGVYTCIYV